MDQKKWVSILLYFCVLCFTVSGELRDFVVIVTPVLHKSAVANLNKIADSFNDNGFVLTAEVFRSYAGGGNWSGFVITDSQGENYIITNRHAVTQAQSVTITVSTYNGDHKTYENCPVIYFDNELDLAVLRFPGGEKVYKRGLNISSRLIKEGSEVWAAGYPFLLGRPEWQFSKGTITNQRAVIPEMADPQVSYIIRHSANTSSGGSGGPLLIRDRTSPMGYSVIGINTWTVSSSRDSYFALPARNIFIVLQKAKRAGQREQDPAACREDLERSCKLLAAELTSAHPDYDKVSRFISYSFADRKGMESFVTMVKTGDSRERETWWKNFYFNSPIETMRLAIFASFWNSIGGMEGGVEVVFKEIDPADRDNLSGKAQVRTTFDINGTGHGIVWAYEYGHWYIVEMNLAQVKKAYGVDTPLLDSPQQGGIGIGLNSCIDVFSDNIEDNRVEMGFLLDIPILSYLSISTGLNWVSDLAPDSTYPIFIQVPVLVRFDYYLDLSSGFIDFGLIPFIALGLGLDYQIDPEAPSFDLALFLKAIGRAGVEIRSNHLSLGIYLAYFIYLTPFYTIDGWKNPLLGAFIKYSL
jgi:S1-C subfamily serine protease